MTKDPYRIHLPLRVATAIVLQGLRIRLGRSLVTVSGVLLGIAILTSTATTYLIKDGVQEEDRIRSGVNRMENFFEAELGSLNGKVIGIHTAGTLTVEEERLIARVSAEADRTITMTVPLDASIEQTDAVLVLDSPAGEAGFLGALRDAGFPRPVGLTRISSNEITGRESLYLVPLSAQLDEGEAAKAEKEKATARYRIGWILAVSLMVTLMGILNAMLMSVTERFREIGTMKCLGATSRLVRRIFLIESLIIGTAGSVCGALLGALFAAGFYSVIYGPALVFTTLSYPLLLLSLAGSVAAGVLLTVCCAIYPASVASAMVPAVALRSNV